MPRIAWTRYARCKPAVPEIPRNIIPSSKFSISLMAMVFCLVCVFCLVLSNALHYVLVLWYWAVVNTSVEYFASSICILLSCFVRLFGMNIMVYQQDLLHRFSAFVSTTARCRDGVLVHRCPHKVDTHDTWHMTQIGAERFHHITYIRAILCIIIYYSLAVEELAKMGCHPPPNVGGGEGGGDSKTYLRISMCAIGRPAAWFHLIRIESPEFQFFFE